MKYLTFILIAGLCLPARQPLWAQQAPVYKNAIGGELGGQCFFGSANYERTLLRGRFVDLNTTVGITIPGFSIAPSLVFHFTPRFAMEAGIGYTFIVKDITASYENEYNTNVSLGSMRIGFRNYLGKNNKTFLRYGYTPVWSFHPEPYDGYGTPDNSYMHWFGFGFGVGF